MKRTNFIRRRQQHVGVLSDGMWVAHDRREAQEQRRSKRTP